jgi:crotonobetainyl-CoA:carnitine CoA-transferase CaiB-like acyl-CoA transferase
LGEHSRSILETLGYSGEEIDALIAEGSVACG